MRSLWKGIFNINKSDRNITISPKFLGLNILIHNGKIYRRKYINQLMIKRKPKKIR
jgi:ribosomal protein S19